jgi:hypothetical protein
MNSGVIVLRRHAETVLLVVALTLLVSGGVMCVVGANNVAQAVWAIDTLVGMVPACGW